MERVGADDLSLIDEPTSRRLSARGRRAVGVIAIAVIAIVVASIAYVKPKLTAQTTTASPPDRPLPVAAPGQFMTFDFVSPSLGWAVEGSGGASVPVANPGQFSVFRTTDGAKHWQRQLTGQSDLSGMNSGSIQMFDRQHGFVVARGSETTRLYRTADGGAHWEPIGLPNTGVQELAFGDSRHGWLLAPAISAPTSTRSWYATGDAGDTWKPFTGPPEDSRGIALRGSSEEWLGSYGSGVPHVYFSADGGSSWQRHDLPDSRAGPSGDAAAAFVNLLPGRGVIAYSFAAGGGADEFTSFDLGASWKAVPPRPTQEFGGGESFEDASHWWAIDGGILYKTSDAGQSWKQASGQIGNGDGSQYYPTVIDSKHAWAQVVTGDAIGLAITNDGGAHWTRASIPPPP